MSPKEWRRITRQFEPVARDSEQERRQLVLALAEYEKIGGAATNTSEDIARTSFFNTHQLDCIDETVNTMSLMMVLENEGYIRRHSLSRPVGRGKFLDWPHYAATLTDNESKEIFVIDSWFRDNGEPALAVPLTKWKSGWNPA